MPAKPNPAQQQKHADPTPEQIEAACAKLREQHLRKMQRQGPGPYLHRGVGMGRIAETAVAIPRR